MVQIICRSPEFHEKQLVYNSACDNTWRLDSFALINQLNFRTEINKKYFHFTGMATWLLYGQLYTGGSREGRQLCRLLRWRR